MKFTRNFRSRNKGLAFAAFFMCASLTAAAQSGGSVDASRLINFSASEKLKAEDAAKILSNRLEINTANDELRSAFVERPGGGLQVERFDQYYKGVRVEHGSFSMTSKNGVASYAFGRFYPTSAVSGITPSMDEATALTRAKAAVPAEKYAWETGELNAPEGRLCLVEDFANGDGDGVLHLAYAFDVYAVQPLARYNVYIDARDGHVLFMDAILKHVAATGASLYSDTVAFNAGFVGGQYVLHDSTRGGGIFTYNINRGTNPNNALQVSSSSNFFTKDAAVDAHWGAGIVYDYWKSTHNRNSWDGTGGPLRSYVHYSNAYNNASWNGSFMVYGDGSGLPSGFPPLVSLDITAHEIGHGVCQATARLAYNRESGAMNEGLSDIWGSVIEAYGDPHENDAIAKDHWLMAEELGNTMRSMKNPKQYGQPNTYLGLNWVNASPACTPTQLNDQCGVHTNSGVLNYWFYLLCTGGQGLNDLGNKYKMTGIGMGDAAKIVYAAELALNSTSNYNSMRTASIAAATTIYGSCSPQLEAVIRAWYAVGVGNDFTPCTPQVSFGGASFNGIENAGVDACQASHVVSVPLNLNGGTLSGDSAVINVVVVGGNAVAGVDYQLQTSSFSFHPGGASSKTIDFLVFDNGAPNGDKYIDITYTLNAGTTNATRAVNGDTTRVMIYNDDYVPYVTADAQRTVLNYSSLTTTATPFYGSSAAAHAQYLYTAAELRAAGVRPNMPISMISYVVLGKVSTLPYYNFTVGLAQTSQSNFSQGVYTGTMTTVYSDSVNTVEGMTDLPLSTPYIWNGNDNLVVDISFSNASSYGSNDRVQAQRGTYVMSALINSNAIPLTVSNLVQERPLLFLTQKTAIESVKNSTRTWNMDKAEEAYFYSAADEELIAAVINPSDSLGCVTVKVSEAGNGFKSATAWSQRSLKEFTISPGNQTGGTTFDAIFYVSIAELAGKDPYKLSIVQTTAVDDNHLMPNDTKIVIPTAISVGLDYVGFRGTFNAFGRFYLTEGNPQVSVKETNKLSDDMWTGANPFTESPVLHWNIAKTEKVSIRLLDISGKLVYGTEQTLSAGKNRFMLNSPANLVPGVYILQVIRPESVFTAQMMKQ